MGALLRGLRLRSEAPEDAGSGGAKAWGACLLRLWLQSSLEGTEGGIAEAHQQHALRQRMDCEEGAHFSHRDGCGAFEREAVGSGADRRERDTAQLLFCRQGEAAPVTARQQFILVVVSAALDKIIAS